MVHRNNRGLSGMASRRRRDVVFLWVLGVIVAVILVVAKSLGGRH
jgi:hypothetical protein